MSVIVQVADHPVVPRGAWSGLDRRQRRGVVGMALVILVLHALGWGALLLFVVPGRYIVDGAVFGVGLGITAYTLGMRHAFDVDHIAAIDSTTRKLVADGRKPLSVGFWFALGHSTIVFVLVALLAFGVKALAATLREGTPGCAAGPVCSAPEYRGLFSSSSAY